MQWSGSVKSNIIRNLPAVLNMPCKSDDITFGIVVADDGNSRKFWKLSLIANNMWLILLTVTHHCYYMVLMIKVFFTHSYTKYRKCIKYIAIAITLLLIPCHQVIQYPTILACSALYDCSYTNSTII